MRPIGVRIRLQLQRQLPNVITRTMRLRLSVLFACGVEAAFVVFLTVFLFKHADPRGDSKDGRFLLALRSY